MIQDVAVPLDVRLRFGRAAAQVIANEVGADILHIKGNTVDASLRGERMGTDVDILVRPRDVQRMDEGVRAAGWRLYSSFEYGSPFGHAQTYLHDAWGYLDLHRTFPGIRLPADQAFDVLGRNAIDLDQVGTLCRVPALDAHAVLLILNAARDRNSTAPAGAWAGADPEARARRAALVTQLRADTAFAAAVGDIELHRRAPDYLLWRAVRDGGPRTAEWWGRIRASSSVSEAFAVALRAPRVNRERLEHVLGHPPTAADVLREFGSRIGRAVREAVPSRRRGRSGRE